MRLAFIAGISTLLLLAGLGNSAAADLPAAAPVHTAPPPILWSWTGFYIGGHIGGASGITSFSDPFGSSIFGDKVRTPGFLAGGQIGYDWQAPSSNFVLGVETDISGFDSEGTSTCFAFSANAINSTCRVRPEVAATLTGRLGVAVGPSGHSLLYVKGGAAWANGTVDTASNNDLVGFSGPNITSSTGNISNWGWTVGAGWEYALAPAWSLKVEYDYLSLGSVDVTNLGSAIINPSTGGTVATIPPAISSVSQNTHELKLGLNYRWGADPLAQWNGYPSPSPVKALPAVWAAGWEIEGGGRYMYSWSQFHKDFGQFTSSGFPSISAVSRMTYDDMRTNSGEFFARLDSPWNFFVKGFIGGGQTDGGHLNDEDFNISFGSPFPIAAYSNTLSSKVTGDISYGVIDAGYDFLRGPGYKVGGFAGYFYTKQNINAFGCTPIANVNCIPAIQTSGSPNITESDTWQALRMGVAGDVMLFDRVKVSGEVAYLPYMTFSGIDHHFFGNTGQLAETFPETGRNGSGVQLEAIVSYYITPQFSVGVGGRYWALWTRDGSTNETFLFPNAVNTQPQFFRATVEEAGVFAQAAYKFSAP